MSSRGDAPVTGPLAFAELLLWSALVAPIGWVLWACHRLTGLTLFRRLARTAGWLYGRSTLLLLSPVIKVRVINPDEALGRTPCIITANHQSILDLYLLGFQGERQVCPVTKSWPFRLLLPFRPCMRTAGYVEAEGNSVDGVSEECARRIREGAALVFYPEGRRSRTGTLGSFHSGAFRIALDENVPIVPMVIKNSFDIIRPGSFRIHPGTIEIEMLPAIDPSEYDAFRREPIPHRALMKHIKAMYEESLSAYATQKQKDRA